MANKLTFKAFKAIDSQEMCKKYLEGHVIVLKDYGITNITSNNNDWMCHPQMYCVVALDSENELVGGIRVQVADMITPLPVEKAIGKMDDTIYEVVRNYHENGGVGELCALWISKKVAGLGVSILLTRAGISVTNQLTIKTLVGICAEYTLKMFKRVGFQVDHTLGTNGEFPYPNNTYVARVLGIMNAESLESAAEYDKERMQSLRLHPVQNYLEKETSESTLVEYNLIIP
jgi:hypothetical protein